jgi:hypothetical protein
MATEITRKTMGLKIMNAKRVLRVSLLSLGVGLSGFFGAGMATANAAPAASTASPHSTTDLHSASSKIKPTHHQKKEIGKSAEKQAKHNGLAVG